MAPSPTERSSAFTSGTKVPDQRIELIVTASAGPLCSGQHVEHNAQRQKPLRALLLTLLPPSSEKILDTGEGADLNRLNPGKVTDTEKIIDTGDEAV